MTWVWLLSTLLLLLALAGAAWDLVRARQLDLFAPHVAFPLTFALLYGGGGLWWAHVREPAPVLPLYPYYFAGLLAFFGGVLALAIPAGWAGGARHPLIGWIPRRLALATAVLFALSAAVTIWIVARTGIPILRSDAETARTLILPQVGGYAYYLARTIALPALLAIVYLFLHFRRLSGLAWLFWPAVAGLGLLALAASGYRNGLILVLLTALVAYSYLVRRVAAWQAALLISALLILVAAYGLFRARGAIAWDLAGVGRQLFSEMAVVPSNFATILDNFPSQIDFFHGRGLLLNFLALAPGKQPVLGPLLKEQLGLDYAGGGFSPSILGSFYLEFGWAALIAGMFLCGLLLAFLYRRLRQRPAEYPTLFYSFVLVYSLITIRTGLLKDIFAVWFLVVLSLVHLYCRKEPRLALAPWLARRKRSDS
ncbi:MAG: O-antigen polymerase [Anaerolineae bacterium]|jgi:oligosaccharide repeat unit polymerase